jgi:hypothetical protein
MAIDLFEELWDERKGTLTSSYTNTFSRSFIVHTDSIEQSDISIYDAIYDHEDCPKIGDLYPGDDDTYAQNVSINPEQSDPQTWKVVIEYSSNPDSGSSGAASAGASTPPPQVSTQQQGQEPGDREADPLVRQPDVKITFAQFPKVLTNINNSAGDPFYPPITIDNYRPIVSIGCNASSINAYDLASYIGKVNSANVTFVTSTGITLGFVAKSARIKGINTEPILEGKIKYWRLTYDLEINTSLDESNNFVGWDLVVRDQGFNIKKADGTLTQALNASGNFVTVPIDLNLGGGKNPPNTPPQYITFDSADVYGTISFSTLPGLGFF